MRHRRLRRAILAPLFAAFILLASAAVAQATTIVVNTTSDAAPSGRMLRHRGDCSLRQAVDKAQSGDTVQLGAGVYSLTLGTDIEITKSVTLEGAGVASTSIDGSQNSPATRRARPDPQGRRRDGHDQGSHVDGRR